LDSQPQFLGADGKLPETSRQPWQSCRPETKAQDGKLLHRPTWRTKPARLCLDLNLNTVVITVIQKYTMSSSSCFHHRQCVNQNLV